MQFITSGNRIAVESFVLGDLYTITFTNGTYINSACIGIGDNFVTFQRNEPELLFSLTMATAELVSSIELYAGGSGTNNYNDLTNKPQINGVELVGNKSLSDLGIQATISDLDTIRSGAAAGATAVQPAALADYQTKIDSSHKLDADLVDDTTATHKFATAAQLSQIDLNKNNILSNKDNGYLQSKNTVVYDLNSPAYITRSINSNGTLHVVADLTSSSQARSLTIASNIDTLTNGEKYVLSGCVGGDYSTTYGFAITNASFGGLVFQSNDPVEFTKTSVMKYLVLVVRVGQNWTKDFAPMICTKADYDRSATYQPWIPSNRELYEMILALQ